MSAFKASSPATDDLFQEEEAETVALSGVHLAELIAASGEMPCLSNPAVSVETTVVIPGSRNSAIIARTSEATLAPVSSTRSLPSIAEPARTKSGRGNSLMLAASGLVFGVLVATSLVSAAPHPGREHARDDQKHERVAEKNRLAGATHQKAAPGAKRSFKLGMRAASSTVTRGARPNEDEVSASPAASPSLPSASQLQEDRQLVLAAQLERSL